MGYCSIQNVRDLLPEKVTIGNQNIGSPNFPPIPGRGAPQRSTLTEAQVENYIIQAGQYIDTRLRSVYLCPLRRIKTFETDILNNLIHGGDIRVELHDSSVFSIGFIVRIQDAGGYEECVVKSIPDVNSIILKKLSSDYSSTGGKCSILEFPDPIKTIAAQLSVAIALDRLYVSEQSPDVSNFSKNQRNLAVQAVSAILMGDPLTGQDFFGKRFQRTSLLNAYKSPVEITRNDEKE